MTDPNRRRLLAGVAGLAAAATAAPAAAWTRQPLSPQDQSLLDGVCTSRAAHDDLHRRILDAALEGLAEMGIDVAQPEIRTAAAERVSCPLCGCPVSRDA